MIFQNDYIPSRTDTLVISGQLESEVDIHKYFVLFKVDEPLGPEVIEYNTNEEEIALELAYLDKKYPYNKYELIELKERKAPKKIYSKRCVTGEYEVFESLTGKYVGKCDTREEVNEYLEDGEYYM